MTEADFGIGAYTPAEAGRLIGTDAQSIRRWLYGYSYGYQGPKRVQRPLWQPEYGLDRDEQLLGFRDLIEARMVSKLRGVGLGLQTIRTCLTAAAEIAEDPHPFSSAYFRTDGQRLFLERLNDEGSHDIIDLKTKQMAFPKIVNQSFLNLDFDDEKATRWFPLAKSRNVVADPERAFGAPIVVGAGVPTKRIAQTYEAEGKSVRKVALLFDIGLAAVRDALAFERKIGGLASA